MAEEAGTLSIPLLTGTQQKWCHCRGRALQCRAQLHAVFTTNRCLCATSTCGVPFSVILARFTRFFSHTEVVRLDRIAESSSSSARHERQLKFWNTLSSYSLTPLSFTPHTKKTTLQISDAWKKCVHLKNVCIFKVLWSCKEKRLHCSVGLINCLSP